jgi:competence ComEA-like helix-hairpin-helix protein
VDLYARRQVALLLVGVLIAAAGLGVDRWRHHHPELAARLETLDRAPLAAPASRAATPRTARQMPRAAAGTRAVAAPPLDLNRATSADLERLPGIGTGLAARILSARERLGPFGSVDDLRRVRGIGPATLARVRPMLAVDPGP